MKNTGLKIYWIFALSLAWFAYFSFDSTTPKWSILGVIIYVAPILTLIFPLSAFRYYVFIFSIFIAVQSAVPSLLRKEFYHNEPNFQREIFYEDGAIPGFKGKHHISVDHKGFRSTTKINYEKAPEATRIFTIGGSTTHMIDMDDHKTWSAHLHAKLSNDLSKSVEVINAGFAGLRAEQNLGTLKHVLAYHPDLAIFLVGTNDWRRHIINQVLGRETSLAYPWENFSLKNSLIGRTVRAFSEKRRREMEDKGYQQIETLYFRKNPNSNASASCEGGTPVNLPEDFPTSVSESFSKSLTGIRDVCKKTGLTCVLVTQPHGYRKQAKGKFRQALSCSNRWRAPAVPLPPNVEYVLRDVDRMGRIADFYNNYTQEFGRRNNLLVCDIAQKIEPSYEMFIDEVHYTERGSEKVADEIFHCIKDLVLGLN